MERKNDDLMDRSEDRGESRSEDFGAASYKHPKMPIELRAKQFMPFAAVTGLEAALREKEREHEEKQR